MSARTFFAKATCTMLLLIAAPASLTATPKNAPDKYLFHFWNTDSGLPQNSVRSILQDSNGYLWFTTLDGVVRFDGVRFSVFNKGNTPGIRSNRFFSLLEDNEGVLWMATEDGGVARYKDGVFTSYTTREGLVSNIVQSMHLDGDGQLLVYTLPGVAKWSGDSFTVYSPGRGEPATGLIYAAASGALWYYLFGKNELFCLKNDVRTSLPLGNYGHTTVTAIYEDRQGVPWVGTSDGRLLTLKNGELAESPLKLSGAGNFVVTMLEDRNNDLLVGSSGSGLALLKDNAVTFYATRDGLSDNDVSAIFEDREGTIWVGTLSGGINRLSRQIISVYTAKDGLAGNSVYPIYQEPDGTIWVGANGLNRFDKGAFTQYKPKPGEKLYSPMSFCRDREGRLWIGGVGGITYLKDGRLTDFSGRIPLPVENYTVWAVYQDRGGSLWFGTDLGLVRYQNDVITKYTTENGLAGNDVKCIYEDPEGTLWFGTYGGLSYFKDGAFKSFTEADGLASNRVRTLYEDEDGTLWIGTYDGGLSRYRSGRFTNYTTQNGLFNNGVFEILDDGRGNFWFGSNLGIYRVSRSELNEFAEGKIKRITSVSYGKQDGLVNIECNGGRQPSGIRTPDGKLWFATQAGAAVVDVDKLLLNPRPPPVRTEEVLLNHEPATADTLERIAPGDASLEIHYAGLSFIRPQDVRFKYRMEGLDHDWVEAGNRRTAYYDYLPPGSYTFVVTAANSDGVWNTSEQRLRITVLPPFYRNWWFITLCGAFLAATVFAAYRVRVNGLRRANAAQEKFSRQLIASQESERKRIAAELHDSLGQNLLVIKNWATLGLSSLKEGDRARAELKEVSDAATQAISEVRAISYNLRPHLLDEVGLAEALKSMINRVASSSGIEFSIEVDPVDGLFSAESEIGIYRIVQETLNNLVRHSEAHRASVAIRRNERDVLIEIVDNGKGLSTVQADGNRMGFGLKGMNERARMLGGKLTVHSTPGQGTRVECTIPITGAERNEE